MPAVPKVPAVLATVALSAFVAWSVTFDWQVRRAGDRFVADQLGRVDRGQPVVLIRHGFTPQVMRAAWRASLAGTAVLAAGVVIVRLATRRRPTPPAPQAPRALKTP